MVRGLVTFISVSANSGARTLSPALVFTRQPADRQGGQMWLNHILFQQVPTKDQSVMVELI